MDTLRTDQEDYCGSFFSGLGNTIETRGTLLLGSGTKIPVASLLVYDLASKKTTAIETGGKPNGYLFNVFASPDGERMYVHSTDRLQKKLTVLEMDLESGKCETIVEQTQPTWQTNHPGKRYLGDGKRFLWSTEGTGYTHFELRDLSGKSYGMVSDGDFQTSRLEWVDEEAGLIGFSGFSSPVWMARRKRV
ncbi:MAG: hypothetical protein GY902_12095 [Planctomycetes bacterium]|nr:hypothetical protein [Planctomycetota bacterium]